MNNILCTIKKEECVGCKACEDACPQNAIEFKEDDEGFWYPEIIENKCVNCGFCKNVCPALTTMERTKDEIHAYMAWSKEPSIRDKSTSGGMFYEFAKYVLNNAGGVVVGSRYSDDYKSASHVMIDQIEDLERLVGSKYVQSNTAHIYTAVLDKLKEGILVFFSGTPCQTAALKAFLNGKISTDKLILMDFVCNAIYSPLVYRKWLDEWEKKEKAKISRVRSKSKKYGWVNRYWELSFDNGKTIYISDEKGENLYIAGIDYFNLYQRECCYKCRFREENHRSSDITVGDYWGAHKESSYDSFKGISFIITNSERGYEYLKNIRINVYLKDSSIEDIKNGQVRMLENPPKSGVRKKFFKNLEMYDFSKALKLSTGYKVPKDKSGFSDFIQVLKNRNVSIMKYIYLNYFCKSVVRKGKAKIVPYKNSVIELDKNAKLILDGYKDFSIGINKLKGSKAETYFRLGKDAIVELAHGGDMYYGSTIEIKNNARFKSGYFGINTGSVMVVDYDIEFGEYVGLGRNNIIYDSDFHTLLTSNGEPVNFPKKVIVGDHVWLPSNITILPGADIGNNVIVTPRSIVKRKIPSNSVYREGKIIAFQGWWSDCVPNKYREILQNKKFIMVGYGKEGKEFYKKYKERVVFIIDNGVKDGNVLSFTDFLYKYSRLDDDSIFVITSSKYYEELYNMIRSKYEAEMIISGSDI